jgi:hypothetical protein
VQINAYIYSTNIVPSVTYNSPADKPQYGAKSGYSSTISWTHQIAITPTVLDCNLLSVPNSDWFVKAGTASIASTDYMVHADSNKSFDIQLARLTSDAFVCA